ncbi:ATP-binding protein [Azospirillum argentinense]
MFFQLVSHRYERGSMLVTSNRSVSEWGTVFGDPDPPSPPLRSGFPRPRGGYLRQGATLEGAGISAQMIPI